MCQIYQSYEWCQRQRGGVRLTSPLSLLVTLFFCLLGLNNHNVSDAYIHTKILTKFSEQFSIQSHAENV